MSREELIRWLESQIRFYYTNASNEEFSSNYRIRCFGCVKGFQMTLAMVNQFGGVPQVANLKIEGEEIC